MKGTATPRSLLLALGALAAIAATSYVVGARDAAPVSTADATAVTEAPARTNDVAAVAPIEVVSASAPKAEVAAAPAPVEAGLRAYLDPETGEIGGMPPGDVDAPGTRIAEGDWHQGLTETRLPDGSYMVNVDGRMQEFSVVQINPDGSKLFRCVHDPSVVHDCVAPVKAEDR